MGSMLSDAASTRRVRAEDYGESWAGVYDELYADRDEPAEVVRFVRQYAEPPTVCEFGIGTGRIALPLSAAGLEVHGVDNSPSMLAQLRAKPDAGRIRVALGDITDPPVRGPFGCVLVAFSTLYLLADQGQQVRCVEAAARLLAPGGALIVEGFIPDPSRWHGGYSLSVTRWDDAPTAYTIGRIDPAAQLIETIRVEHHDGALNELPNRLRYVLPAELDLIAERAGLRLAGRFADFAGAPLGPGATDHVSVYRQAPTPEPTIRRPP